MATRAPKLTAKRLREVLDYNPDTGEFRWKVDHAGKNSRCGDRAGARYSNGYRVIMVDGERYGEHRLAVLIMTGRWPLAEVDHENLDRGDNRWCNIREATRTQNMANRPSHNPLGKGVRLNRSGTYRAIITVAGRKLGLGSYTTPQEAHQAFVTASQELHGEFARAA